MWKWLKEIEDGSPNKKIPEDKETKLMTPLGVGSHLVGWVIKEKNIIEKDWWESF